MSKKQQTSKKLRVPINSEGKRIGAEHPRAKLSADDIELILYLREAGLSYLQIARKFDDGTTVSKSHVRNVCLALQRAQTPARYKTIVR